MFSAEQLGFFLNYPSFQPIVTAKPHEEFSRLAVHRQWPATGPAYRKANQVFQTLPALDALTDDDSSESDGDSLNNLMRGVNINSTNQFNSHGPNIKATFAALMNARHIKKGSKRYAKEAANYFAQAAHDAAGANSVNEIVLRQLCMDLEIDPIPDTITQMKKAIRRYHVDIWEYLEFKLSPGAELKKFTNFHKFLAHMKKKPVFPKEWAKESPLLKFLLRTIF